MTITTWDEIRTAYHVARAGTVSGAAEALGVHHATVIRHVDALEGRLGVKLFQRHARGYTPTEAGLDLLQVAQATDDQFAQLSGRIRGRGETMTGEIVVTSLGLLAPRMAPALVRFRAAHPDLIVRYLTGERLFRLEYGEAHVAIRAGPPPEEPDNVVQAFGYQAMGLFGSAAYLARRPPPETDADLAAHDFVSLDGTESRAPFVRWLNEQVDPERIVFRASDHSAVRDAVLAGAGLGFVSRWDAERFPDLVPVLGDREAWRASLWLVTHVDLHRTTKVQALLRFLKQDAAGWSAGN
jgi:DNA-binding transcriptional LysR family regulator